MHPAGRSLRLWRRGPLVRSPQEGVALRLEAPEDRGVRHPDLHGRNPRTLYPGQVPALGVPAERPQPASAQNDREDHGTYPVPPACPKAGRAASFCEPVRLNAAAGLPRAPRHCLGLHPRPQPRRGQAGASAADTHHDNSAAPQARVGKGSSSSTPAALSRETAALETRLPQQLGESEAHRPGLQEPAERRAREVVPAEVAHRLPVGGAREPEH